jgi:DNA-binding winged helix-turn-helix (wHTH) protein/tetratricopeptide (TPR) repeat protein
MRVCSRFATSRTSMSTIQGAGDGVIYRFDRFELSTETGQLRKQGVLVHLGPKPFRALLLLASRAGNIVTREEMQDALWGSETFVDFDQGLNAVIRRIRFALNDQAETPRFVQTIPRRGYCFLVNVERVEPSDASKVWETTAASPLATEPPPASTSAVTPRLATRAALAFTLAITLAATLLATRGPHKVASAGANATGALRIAIGPVIIDSPGSDFDPRGLSGELHRFLSRLPPERVRVVTPGSPADLRIDTALRKTTEGISADARLTELSTGRQVWRESLHRTGDPTDFSLEVAIRVTRTVIHLYVPRRSRESPVRTPVSPRAMALYREAQAIRNRPVPQLDYKRAVKLLEQAVALEPRFVEAWSALGDIWTVRSILWKGNSRKEAIVQARTTLDRAIALDPQCADALNNRGVLLMMFERSFREAETALRAAIHADPALAETRVNLAMLLAAIGRHEESVSQIQRAQQLDPAWMLPSPALGFLYLMGNRYGDAYAEYRASLASLREPQQARWGMASVAIAAGRWDDAAQALSAATGDRIVLPGDAAERNQELRRQFRLLEERLPSMGTEAVDPYTMACFHAQSGDADRAFAALDRAAKIEQGDTMFAYVDPRLDSIRNDPRFPGYLVRFGLLR